jgi:hypothetical protein
LNRTNPTQRRKGRPIATPSVLRNPFDLMAGSTGLEPATSGLTVQCANQAAPRAHVSESRPDATRVEAENATMEVVATQR